MTENEVISIKIEKKHCCNQKRWQLWTMKQLQWT